MVPVGLAWLAALSAAVGFSLTRRNGSGALRNEMTEHYATRADLRLVEANLVRWMIGSVLGAVGTTAAITFALGRLLYG